MALQNNTRSSYLDSKSVDAFNRLRVSGPTTLFDTSFEYDESPLQWVSKTVGSGTYSHKPNKNSVELTTTLSNGDRCVYQTRNYHRYLPGKSQLIMMTMVFGETSTGTVKKVGYFDDNDGIFLEQDGDTTSFVIRSSTSGSAVNNRVNKSNWNIDKLDGTGVSGITLDITKGQILIIDFEWLSVGRVRIGFIVDGVIRYAHEFLHANVATEPYMATPNLPLRYEIENETSDSADSMLAICSTVISEGGFQERTGRLHSISRENSAINLTSNTDYLPIISIRPKQTVNGLVNRGQIVLTDLTVLSVTNPIEYKLLYDVTLSGASFTSVDDDCIAEYDISATTYSGGHQILTGYVAATTAAWNRAVPDTLVNDIRSELPMSLDVDGNNPIIVTLVARAVGASTDVYGGLNWKEYR